MSQERVTVVVPVYNVEEFLQECLDSLAAQTVFHRCRIVIVDDGSTDGSGAIARRFAAEHSNVLVHRQENGGLGAARNAGMDLAETPYVMFCDSDDVLPPRAVEALLNGVEENRADLAVGYMETFPKPTNWAWKEHFGQGHRLLHGIEEAPDLVHSASACNKLFSVETLRAAGARFRERTHFEDAFLVIPQLLAADRIALVDETVYLYRKRTFGGSIMDSLFTRPDNYWDHLLLVEELVALRGGLPAAKHPALDRFLARSFQGFLLRGTENLPQERHREFYERARAVYRRIAVADLVHATVNTRHRVPYLALLIDDWTLFTEPARRLRAVVVRDGRLHLDIDVPDELRGLTQVTKLTAHLEQLRERQGGRSLLLSGRYTVDGLPLDVPMDTPMYVTFVGGGPKVPATPVHRADLAPARPDLAWGGFEAEIPLGELKQGNYEPRFGVETATGPSQRSFKATQAYLRDSRLFRSEDVRLLPLCGVDDRVYFQVRRGRGLRGRLAWWRPNVSREVRHIVGRGPFWKQRLVLAATRPFMRSKNIWLIGERPDTVQDNSGHLFRYLRGVERRKHTYYLLRRDSADAARLKGLGKVVAHGSLRHKFLYLHARTLINSYDIDAYMLPPDWDRGQYLRNLAWRVGAKRVFLQHGVIHNDPSAGLHRGRSGVHLMVASADQERDFIAERMDYRDAVKTLGLPRFDALVPQRGGRRVLFMPTWRAYLVAPSYDQGRSGLQGFAGSAYDNFLRGFLGSPELAAALQEHGYVLEVMPHYEMRDLVRPLVPDSPCFQWSEQSERGVQNALRECDLFVTDWSSTAFDVAYMGTPLVYAQFDADEFYGGHYRRGYFEHERDGYGPVATTVEETVDAVVRYLERGCVRENEYDRRAEKFFGRRDQENCARVATAIQELDSSW